MANNVEKLRRVWVGFIIAIGGLTVLTIVIALLYFVFQFISFLIRWD